MSKNKIDDLRDHLFATLEALQDKDDPMDLDRAKAIANVSNSLIASAKVEVDLLRVTGGMPDSNLFRKGSALPAPGAAVKQIEGKAR